MISQWKKERISLGCNGYQHMNAFVPHVNAIADFADEDQQLGSKYVLIKERIFAFNHN
jgi:hypothetical protein